MTYTGQWPRISGFSLLLVLWIAAAPAHASPLTLEFSGSIFFVVDDEDVFATESGDTYSLFLTYDAALLPGMDVGDTTYYRTAAGETAITFTFMSSGGDTFVSDNSFPIEIGIRNTPDWLVTMNPGDGQDTMWLEGQFDAVTEFNLVLWESLGKNPLSSNDLPTGAFGSGPGTWSVSELDIDRLDMFANISGSVSNIEEVVVPEPSTLSLSLWAGMALWLTRRRNWRHP
jgi:hypothetical protein